MTKNSYVQPAEGKEEALIGNIVPFASRAQHRRRPAAERILICTAAPSVPADDDDPGPTAA
jgi:hypothetical protein